jgi:uncharacterized MAPEG superfamily protein
MDHDENRKRRFTLIMLAYPFALLLLAVAANLWLFGVGPLEVALPSRDIVIALALGTAVLIANHTWLMTSTELTRLEFGLHATPEEWQASGRQAGDASSRGMQELARRHNAHRNATENTVCFALAALVLSVVTPAPVAAQVWIAGFVVGRLGHSYGFLSGRDDIRGLFMSVSLISLYGAISYPVLSLVA